MMSLTKAEDYPTYQPGLMIQKAREQKSYV